MSFCLLSKKSNSFPIWPPDIPCNPALPKPHSAHFIHVFWHSLIHPAKEYWIDVINIMLVRPCVLRGRWSCVHTSHCSPLIPPNFQEQSAIKRMFEEKQDKKHRTCCWPPNRKKWNFFYSIWISRILTILVMFGNFEHPCENSLTQYEYNPINDWHY